MESFKNEIASICTFNINKDPLMKAFSKLGRKSEHKSFSAYGKICSLLLLSGKSLGEYLHDMLIYSDSEFIAKASKNPDIFRKKAIESDLAALSHLAKFTSGELKEMLVKEYKNELFRTLPDFETGVFDYSADYFIDYAAKNGNGIFAEYRAFSFTGGELKPIQNVDPIRISDLKNYEVQRNAVINNTLCFLKGFPAQNVLLYGDRGTGKSSTVKAILNEYQELRMAELSKNDVDSLPVLFNKLKDIPLKFIIMIDDLTFSENDERFGILKAVLEGSIAARPDNILIYATTNRRKIIRETSAGRADEINRADAVDESMSLIDRFGLFITFSKPDKEVYLDIVKQLAEDNNIEVSEEELFKSAERFALKKGGRSPRNAKQFIEMMKGSIGFKGEPL